MLVVSVFCFICMDRCLHIYIYNITYMYIQVTFTFWFNIVQILLPAVDPTSTLERGRMKKRTSDRRWPQPRLASRPTPKTSRNLKHPALEQGEATYSQPQ